MKRAQELRQKAKFCRRLAAVPTVGGHSANRTLLEMALRLEKEVEVSDQLEQDDPAINAVEAAPTP
jgi:hypothetical protein